MYFINIKLPRMFLRVNLKISCFTWIVFLELNFTVAFLKISISVNKESLRRPICRYFKKWGYLSNAGKVGGG